MSVGSWWSRTALTAWGILLVGALTWPFLLSFASPSAAFALRDMMVLPHPALTHAAVGFGDLPARNAPQDGVLAIVGKLVPATWFVAALMVTGAGAAAWVGAQVGSRPWTRAAAMTVAVWNPFAVERLLQGQWSLALAAWLLPAVALCRGPGQLLAICGASLTPTGGLFAFLTSLTTTRRATFFSLLASLPWVVPALLGAGHGAGSGTASAASAAAFAPRAETFTGTLGALLGLGGIWNAGAVPASRSAGFAVAGVVLFAVLCLAWRHVPRRLLALAACGFAVPLISWLLPGAMAWLVSTVPGAGLLRDAQKFVALALPAFVFAAARLDRVDPRLPAVTLLLALAQVPDAPRALAALTPVHVAVPDVDHRGRDVFFDGRPHLLTRPFDGIPIVDPATKAMNVVESGVLSVDGVRVDEPSPRWRAATDIFGTVPQPDLPSDSASGGNPAAQRYYSDPQVALVVHPDGSVEDTGYPARALPRTGIALLVLWFLLPVLAAVLVVSRGGRRR